MINILDLEGIARTSRESVRRILDEISLGVVDNSGDDVSIFPHLRVEERKHFVGEYRFVSATDGMLELRNYGTLPKGTIWNYRNHNFRFDNALYDLFVKVKERDCVFSLAQREEAISH